MASKFMRRRTWWAKFHHPVTGARIRESLETHDPSRAELLRRRIELKVELCDPRFRAADIPARLRDQVAHFQIITLRSGFLPVLVRAVKHRHEQVDFCPPERLIS